MPLVTGANRRIFFAHVPKTGGSSVEAYLIRRFGGPLSLKDVTHRNGRRRRGLISLSTARNCDIRYSLVAAEDIRFCGTPTEYEALRARPPFGPTS